MSTFAAQVPAEPRTGAPGRSGGAEGIELSEPVNLRDLGGIPVDGGAVAAGFAIRSDDLATVPRPFAERLVAGGLRTVIDLRSRDEVRVTGRGPLLDLVSSSHHVPLVSAFRASSLSSRAPRGGSADAGFEPSTYTGAVSVVAAASAGHGRPAARPPLGEVYALMLERAARPFVTALAIMAYSEGATAFHCGAGKDRSGVLAAALLLALGASDDQIVVDYRESYKRTLPITRRLRGNMRLIMEEAGIDLDEIAENPVELKAESRDEEAMGEALAALRRRHGDPLAPLRAAGLDDGLIAALRRRAVV